MLSPLPQRLPSLNDETDAIRTIVFSLADMEQTAMAQYLFAMPAAAVEKAIVYPSERVQLRDGIGMMNLGDKTLTIVDLRQKFTAIDPQHDTSKFLILFHTHAGELCGLPVKEAPVLMDIAPDTIRSIPLAYREVNQLSFASRMAIVPQSEGIEPLQILLLGFDSAMPPSLDRQLNGSTSHLN
ncbi:chemotaxis protein CheW [Chamaesiphon sp. VAR_69_metabat_338]|uniref:chemotaxis protein CheW n=1 Tax=Chamaesiphon sp. VAR_69_metabat_338 TaxID=2964704 RepID=UPI00286DBED2|nr:chemotaxis protein CheW [Chamaesiphon sp. VAR_69_metabat_338]